MTAPPDLPRRPAITFAARLEGRDGWVLEETLESLREVQVRLRHEFPSLLELRVLSQGVTRLRPDATWFVPDPSFGLRGARRDGWYFEDAASCWRAPDETILPPPTKPVWGESLAVDFAPPVAGWIDLTIAKDGNAVAIGCSNLFDPVRAMLHFLERALAGAFPRLMIDQEGHFAEWHALPPPPPDTTRSFRWHHMPGPNLRFVVAASSGGWPVDEPGPSEPRLDLVLPRRALVLAVYRAWRLIALGDKARWSAEWMTHLDQERDGPCYPNGRVIPTDAEMRALLSEALETALAAELRA
jgi:hypothetical protein